MRQAAPGLLLSLFLVGCGGSDPCGGVAGTCLSLEIGGHGIDAIDQLLVHVHGAEIDSQQPTGAQGGGEVSLPVNVALEFPSLSDGTVAGVDVEVVGQLGGRAIASGTTQAELIAGAHTAASVTLQGGAPDDAGCLRDGPSQALVASLSPSPLVVHTSTASHASSATLTATLTGLVDCDLGTVSFAAGLGSFGAPSCTRNADQATCTVLYTAPIGGTADQVTATSDDSGAAAMVMVDLRTPVVVSAIQRIDLLAFGTPSQQVTVQATLDNLIDGDPTTVQFSLSGASASLVSNTGSSAVIAALPLPIPTPSAPAPATLTITADADPSATASVSVVVHAWVDQTPQFLSDLNNAIGGQFAGGDPETWTVAETPSGTVLVGGKVIADGHENAYAVVLDNGTWVSAGYHFGVDSSQNGAITSAVATPAGDFLITGVGDDGTHANDTVIALHCKRNPTQISCGDVAGTNNLAPAAQSASSAPVNPLIGGEPTNATDYQGPFTVTVNPRIVLASSGSSIFKYLSWTTSVPGECGDFARGSNGAAHLLAETSGNLDAPFVMDSAHAIPFGTAAPVSSIGNSCPLTSYEPANVVTGWAVGDGAQLWVAGYADCQTVVSPNENGCPATADQCGCLDMGGTGMNGLAATPVATAGTPPQWTTYQTPLKGVADIRCPVIKRGLDDALLVANGCFNSSGATVGWFAKGQPTMMVTTPPPSGNGDFVNAIGGSATGGTPWSGGQADLFFAVVRRTLMPGPPYTKSFYFGWQSGSTRRVVQIGNIDYDTQLADASGFELLDFSSVKLTTGEVELWAVGHSYDPGGYASGPRLMNLR
jgi:hypothetical protein